MRRQQAEPVTAEMLAATLEAVTEAATMCGANAIKLRGTFEAQGWSPQIAEQMALQGYNLMLLGGDR